MPLDLDELERIARAATPGPWGATDLPYNGLDDPCIYAGDVYVAQTVYDMQSPTQKHDVNADTIYIATFNPVVVLELIAAARAALR